MPGAAKDPREFPTTSWRLITESLSDATSVRTAALRELVLLYEPPLCAHLMLCKRLNQELAGELLQGFMTDKILARTLLRRADRTKGKFRSLLLRSLKNYFVDWNRARSARPATGKATVLAEASTEAGSQADVFDIAWARQLFHEVLAAMKSDCHAHGQANIWGVFECRLLAPVYGNTNPLPYEEVCERFGFTSPEQASNALVTAKRKFQRTFERVVGRYQHDGEEPEDILRELIGILSQAGSTEWRQLPAMGDGAQVIPSAVEGGQDSSLPSLVAHLLELKPDADELWRPEDLGGLMRHQLAQRLDSLCPEMANHLPEPDGATTAAPLITLSDLLRHPAPPLSLLEAVKAYGRARVHRPEATLPAEIASAVYFGSIAAALVRHGRRITTSADDVLRWGFEQLLKRSWLGAPLRGLLEEGVALLSNRGDAG